MPLATAPCPKCRTLLVYGQRQCLRCGERFDYGASPPPEPTPQQIHEALAHAGGPAAPAAAPPAPPPPVAPQPPLAPAAVQAQAAAEEDLIDRGRYDDSQAAQVHAEEIPGFIDSTLFAAFTPKEVAVERIADLESTQVEDAGAPTTIEPQALELEQTSFQAVGDVQGEDIPGFIDSTLFKAFTPAEVQTETPDGLEVLPTAFSTRAGTATPARAAADDELEPCSDCGARHDRVVCPACGARRRGD